MEDREFICHSTDSGERVFMEIYEQLESPPPEQILSKFAEQRGLEYLDQGGSRVAYIDPEGDLAGAPESCVVKIAKFKDPWQTEIEWQNYNTVNDKARKHLLTITDHADDFEWAIYPYAKTDVTVEDVLEVEIGLLEAGYNVPDLRKENVGIAGGRPVAIDYGFQFRSIEGDSRSLDELIDLKKWKHGVE